MWSALVRHHALVWVGARELAVDPFCASAPSPSRRVAVGNVLMSALAMLMDTPTFKTANESTRTLQERHLKQVCVCVTSSLPLWLLCALVR